jgi:hypothetical protein
VSVEPGQCGFFTTPRGLGRATATSSAAFFPHFEQRILSASSFSGGREKDALKVRMIPTRKQGIVYAEELQVLKILGHPVGTASAPVSIFGTKRRR